MKKGSVRTCTDLRNITVSYEGAAANDEKRDAFYAVAKAVSFSSAATKEVTLTRPFAQVNVATGDVDVLQRDGVSLTDATSTLTVTNVANTFCMFDGKATVVAENATELDAEFTVAGVPAEKLLNVGTENKSYDYLAMAYVLVPNADGSADNTSVSTISSTVTVQGLDAPVTIGYEGATLKQNHRTNLVGKLLTTSVDYNVVVDSNFDGEFDTVELLSNVLATGGSVVLTEDIAISSPLIVSATEPVTINLNGNKIVSTESIYEKAGLASLISVSQGATLTIEGEGTVDGSAYDDYAIEANGGTVNINGGNIIGSVTAAYITSNGGTLNINGGTFSVPENEWGTTYVINRKEINGQPQGEINVTGGTFVGLDPAAHAADPNAPVNYVEDGYVSYESAPNVWTVVKADEPVEVATPQAFESIVAAGGSATLANDITINDEPTASQFSVSLTKAGTEVQQRIINNDVSIDLNGKVLTYKGNDILWRVVDGGTLTINGEVSGSSIVTETSNPTATTANGYVASANGGTINVNGGSFICKNTCTIFQTNGGTLNITGGRFEIPENDDDYGHVYVLNNIDATTSTVNVTGGSFYKYDPSNSNSENPKADFVHEGYTVKQNGDWYDVYEGDAISSDEDLKTYLTQDKEHIVVSLTKDMTYSVGAREAYAMGGTSTKSIVINGNGHTLTFNHTNSDWSNITTVNGAKLIIKNAHLTNSGKNDGPWNRHDLYFACPVELTDITSDKAMAFNGDATLTNVTISDVHPKNSEAYGIWIRPNGQNVSLDNCKILAHSSKTTDRGIKIDNQYLDSEKKVTLTVKNTTFVTQKKAAILVKSTAGADILVVNIDITGVAADNVNAVWVDSDTAEYFDNVTVTGCTKYQEQ